MPRGKKNRTLINYIIDASGSMSGVVNQVRDGFQEYISELKKNGKGEIVVTLTTFDTTEKTHYVAKPIEEIESIDYVIGGMTALYDAIANTVKRVEKQVKTNDRVITVIMTDGQENSSRENTEREVADLIKDKQDKGNWTFVFLGANQDSWATASRFNIPVGNTMNYAYGNTVGAMRGMASATAVATATPSLSSVDYFNDAGQSQEDYDETNKKKLCTPDGKNSSSNS